jgi:hypothetical protein
MNANTVKKEMYKATYYDYLLAAVIVILSASPLLSFVKPSGAPSKAVIYRNNTAIGQIELKDDAVINVGEMQIEVKGKKVRVLKTDCPNKICKHAGWISSPGQSLICLPNKVVVEIPVDHKNGKYDVITY